jgi:TPR repeat protein
LLKIFIMKNANRMGWIIALGLGVNWIFILGASEQDSQDPAFDAACKAAAKGDPKVEFTLARDYANGKGVTRDYARAIDYARQAAAHGYAPAETGLGAFYARGLGVPQDFAEALQWYRKAAAQGDSLAEYSLGSAYAHGDGVSKDMSQALKWWQLSAAQGQVYAENALGQFYFQGEHYGDTNINYGMAAKWLLKASEQDYLGAMNNLAYLYQHGLGVKEDWQQALKWYRRAAERGDAMAQANLGSMYESGDGVPIDKVEAFKWYSLSAEQGNVEGRHSVWEFDTYHALTPDQRAEAKQRVAQFHAQERPSQPEEK